MKTSWLLIVAGFAILLSACDAGNDDVAVGELADTMVTDIAPEDMGMSEMEATSPSITVNLQPLNDSGASGDATIMEAGGQLSVTVRLVDAPEGDRPGHIHGGTCDDLGGVVEPLETVTVGADGTGTSTSTVAMDMTAVADGQHVVNFHGDGGTPIACGAVPMYEM